MTYDSRLMPRKEAIRMLAHAIDKFMVYNGLTRKEFAVRFNFPKRTLERLLENRDGSKGSGHTKFGPLKSLRSVLEKAEGKLPKELTDALNKVVYYEENFIDSLGLSI